MKYTGFFKKNNIASRRGFTLTEVLLAVMIVGLIAVALASLTRAAARESGGGRSKIMLRNNLSSFIRTLRRDMSQATRVDKVSGAASCGSAVVLLQLAQNVDGDGNAVIEKVTEGSASEIYEPKYITYCFKCGSDTKGIVPSGARRGGAIYRRESNSSYPSCSVVSSGEMVLNNVKYIPSSYPVPYFVSDAISRSWTNSLLTVHLITELNSTPVVNEVVEETFAMPMGY